MLMHARSVLAISTLVFGLIGCSVYQSDGREFLENEGFEFALQGTSVSAVQTLEDCAQLSSLRENFFEDQGFDFWVRVEDFDFWVFRSTDQRVSLTAYQKKDENNFVCQRVYKNQSALEESFEFDRQGFQETILKLMSYTLD